MLFVFLPAYAHFHIFSCKSSKFTEMRNKPTRASNTSTGLDMKNIVSEFQCMTRTIDCRMAVWAKYIYTYIHPARLTQLVSHLQHYTNTRYQVKSNRVLQSITKWTRDWLYTPFHSLRPNPIKLNQTQSHWRK